MTGRRGKIKGGRGPGLPCRACTDQQSHHGCVVWGNMCDCTGEADGDAALAWFLHQLNSLPPTVTRRKRPRGQRPA